MGAVGHMRGVDSAFTFIMAATDDKLLQSKASQKAVQNTLGVTQTMHIYVVHTEPAEGVVCFNRAESILCFKRLCCISESWSYVFL